MELRYKSSPPVPRTASASLKVAITTSIMQFGRRLLSSAVLALAACSSGDQNEMPNRSNTDRDMPASNSSTDMGAAKTPDLYIKLPEPEPCKTPDGKYSFGWNKLTFVPPGNDFPFFGYDRGFISSPIRMIWILNPTGADDKAFHISDVLYALKSDKRLVRPTFLLRPLEGDNYSQLYSRAAFCAREQGVINGFNLLWDLFRSKFQLERIDIGILVSNLQVDPVKFQVCFAEDNQKTDEALSVELNKISNGGIPKSMSTPVFVLFNPENNRCTALIGIQPYSAFEERAAYLGIPKWPR